MSTPIEAALARAAHWAAETDQAARAMQAHYNDLLTKYPDSAPFVLVEQAEYVTALGVASSAHNHLATALRDQLDADTLEQVREIAYREALPGDPEAAAEGLRSVLDAWQRAVMFTARDLNEQIAEVDEVVAASDAPLPENKAWTDALRWALKVLAKHAPKAVPE